MSFSIASLVADPGQHLAKRTHALIARLAFHLIGTRPVLLFGWCWGRALLFLAALALERTRCGQIELNVSVHKPVALCRIKSSANDSRNLPRSTWVDIDGARTRVGSIPLLERSYATRRGGIERLFLADECYRIGYINLYRFWNDKHH